jgi:hypothetical protein
MSWLVSEAFAFHKWVNLYRYAAFDLNDLAMWVNVDPAAAAVAAAAVPAPPAPPVGLCRLNQVYP